MSNSDGTVIKSGVGHLDGWFSNNVVLPTMPFWHSLGATPNMLTTLSLLASGASLHQYSRGQVRNASLLLLLRMYFDFADGIYARKYRMTSRFGDLYDHFTDVTYFFGFVYLTWQLYPRHRRFVAVVVTVLFALLSCVQMSCIERRRQGATDNDSLKCLELVGDYCDNGGEHVLMYFDNSIAYLVMIGMMMGSRANSRK